MALPEPRPGTQQEPRENGAGNSAITPSTTDADLLQGLRRGRRAAGPSSQEAAVATALVRFTLRKLTANLLRVLRGAGKPHEIGIQASRYLEALTAHRKVAGMFPHAYDLIGFLFKLRVEERFMAEQFPQEYPGYKARTPALLPGVGGKRHR